MFSTIVLFHLSSIIYLLFGVKYPLRWHHMESSENSSSMFVFSYGPLDLIQTTIKMYEGCPSNWDSDDQRRGTQRNGFWPESDTRRCHLRGSRGQPMRDGHNKVYKALSDVNEGKEGRFRETLLGKRVDYSGKWGAGRGTAREFL